MALNQAHWVAFRIAAVIVSITSYGMREMLLSTNCNASSISGAAAISLAVAARSSHVFLLLLVQTCPEFFIVHASQAG